VAPRQAARTLQVPKTCRRSHAGPANLSLAATAELVLDLLEVPEGVLPVVAMTASAPKRGPLDALGIDIQAGVDSTNRVLPWLSDYIIAMTPVLLSLVHAPRKEG
jgi:hypothetical protein